MKKRIVSEKQLISFRLPVRAWNSIETIINLKKLGSRKFVSGHPLVTGIN